MRIETSRLVLRSVRESDFEDLYEYHSDPETVRYINWPVRTRGQVIEALERYSLIPDFSKDGDSALLGWELKETGKIIGQCSFTFESIHNQNGMIGYVMNPKFAGRGYAFEAVSALIAHVFNTFGVRRIAATIDPRNDKSIALITRLGFIHESTLIQNEFIKDEWVDTARYVIRRSEFGIREATQDEFTALAAIHLTSLTYAMPRMPRMHTVEEDLDFFEGVVTAQHCWVADVEGSVVGFIAVRDSWVNHLYVLPGHHGIGIGAALLNITKEISPLTLQLWTFQENLQARTFYKKHGFVEVELTDGAGNEERTPDVRLVWESPKK